MNEKEDKCGGMGGLHQHNLPLASPKHLHGPRIKHNSWKVLNLSKESIMILCVKLAGRSYYDSAYLLRAD